MSDADGTIILCPLAFEAASLRRHHMGNRATIITIGPGPDAMLAWLGTVDAKSVSRVILAGLAGALTSRCPPGSAWSVSRIIDEHGTMHRAPLGRDDVTLTTSNRVVASREARRAVADRDGADLVDMEGALFARHADAAGWRWAIVRGVSDGPARRTPRGMHRWTSAHGRTRVNRVIADLLCRPHDIPATIALARSSGQAMRAAAGICRELIEDD